MNFRHYSTLSANSMQLEEMSTMASFTLTRMLKSNEMLLLWNFLASSSLFLSTASISTLICFPNLISLLNSDEQRYGLNFYSDSKKFTLLK